MNIPRYLKIKRNGCLKLAIYWATPTFRTLLKIHIVADIKIYYWKYTNNVTDDRNVFHSYPESLFFFSLFSFSSKMTGYESAAWRLVGLSIRCNVSNAGRALRASEPNTMTCSFWAFCFNEPIRLLEISTSPSICHFCKNWIRNFLFATLPPTRILNCWSSLISSLALISVLLKTKPQCTFRVKHFSVSWCGQANGWDERDVIELIKVYYNF